MPQVASAEHKAIMTSHGVPESAHDAVLRAAAVSGLSFSAILALLIQYGPTIWELIQKLFPPAPNPTPSGS